MSGSNQPPPELIEAMRKVGQPALMPGVNIAFGNPLLEKVTPEHITTVLSNARLESNEAHERKKHKRASEDRRFYDTWLTPSPLRP
jgi:hypothetical protein